MSNLQETFNKIWFYANSMQGPSVLIKENKIESCAYRGENGNKCLIGALIPDEKYSPKLETESLLSKEFEDIIGSLSDKDIPFLLRCQRAHDQLIVGTPFDKLNVIEWKNNMLVSLKMIAIDWNLLIPIGFKGENNG